MTVQLIITLCVLLLFAYIFDKSAAKQKSFGFTVTIIGLGSHTGTRFVNLRSPLMPLLPFLGTMGLILIVLKSMD
jgi:uncharacterized membrane protein YcaP (DUF421 family)